MKKEIMFVTGSMGRGGAERVISILSKHYVDIGYRVSILMLLHSNTSGYELDSRVEIIDVSNEKRNAALDIPRLVLCVRKNIVRRKPETIVCFMAQNILITGLASIGLKQKLIVSERIDPASVKRNFLFRIILNSIYANCTKTIFQTERAKSYFPTKVQRNSVIIANPISVLCTSQINKKKKVVTAGRLTDQKNHEMLIEAFSNVHEKYPDYELCIFGEGPKRNDLEKLIKKLCANDYIKLKGSSSQLHKDMADASMFVLPSNYEGLSNVLLESLMMGIPTISTNCAGSDEVIRDGYNGLLVPVGNKKELEKAIIRLIENKYLAESISCTGRKDALEKYAVERIISEWDKEII